MKTRNFGLAILTVAVSLAAAPPEKPVKFSAPWGAPPPGDPIREPFTWNFRSRGTDGIVKAVEKDGITLYYPPADHFRLHIDPVNGAQLREERIGRSPAWPDKKFSLAEELAQGRYVKDAPRQMTYRVSDLCVGDWVTIEYDRRNGVDYVRTICIDRRPGSLVPPAPGEDPNAFRKHHEKANADQAWRENRTPYPRKYWPTYRGADGKFYDSPYPSESTRIVPVPAPKS